MSKKENKKRVEEELYDMEEDIANSNDEYWLLNVEEEKSAFEEEMALRDAYFELYNSPVEYEDPGDFEPEEEEFEDDFEDEFDELDPEPLQIDDEYLENLDKELEEKKNTSSKTIDDSDDDLPF